MYVIVDGATLALLLYKHINSKGREMGFLVGEKMEKIQSGISDSQMHTAKVHSYMYVTSFIPWPQHKYLYGRNGHIDEGMMQEMLQTTDQTLIGWYSFRHVSSQIPSMKEVSIHRNLIHSAGHDTNPEDFVFFLCTSSASSNLSTHSYDHVFMVHRNERFVNIPMTVKNLGDTSRVDYIVENSSPATSKVVRANLGKSEKNFVTSSGQLKQVTEMKKLVAAMSQGLESSQTKVTNSEMVLNLLDLEVSALRDRVAVLEKEEMKRAFVKAEKQKLKQEEEKRQQERNQAAEEEEQMNKLLLDLGLAPQADQSVVQHQQTDAAISRVPAIIPMLEAGVNPLYVSTLNDFCSSDTDNSTFVNFDPNQIQGESYLSSHKQNSRQEVQLPNTVDKQKTKDSGAASVSLSNNSFNSSIVEGKPRDPFDFVAEEVKSKLKVNVKPLTRQSRNTKTKDSDEINHPSTSKASTTTSQHEKDKYPDRLSNHQNCVIAKPDANGHIVNEIDEHDGPVAIDSLSTSPCLSDDVITVSSSPVF